MRISAKAEYAVRATLELTVSPDGSPVKGTKLAEAQDIPLQFLEHLDKWNVLDHQPTPQP